MVWGANDLSLAKGEEEGDLEESPCADRNRGRVAYLTKGGHFKT